MTDTTTDVLPAVNEEPPDDKDLTTALAAAAPRRWRNRATPWLFAAVLLAGGFLGGVQVQKQWGKTATTVAATSGSGGQMPTGGRPSGGPGGFRPGSGSSGGAFGPGPERGGTRQATTGTLTAVTADALTMTTSDGRTVTVKLAGTTRIQQTVTVAALTAGRSVTVQGSTATDGTITATTVTAS